MERKKSREAARAEIEQVKKTAGFEDNKEAMEEFKKLIGEGSKSETREQKLEAERSKQSEKSAVMTKGGAAPMEIERKYGLSDKPPEHVVSSSGADIVKNLAGQERERNPAPFGAETRNLAAKERKGNSVPFGAETGKNLAGKEREGNPVPFGADNSDRNSKWRSKRYQSRFRGHEEERGEDKRNHDHSRKQQYPSHQSRSKRHEEELEEGEVKRDHKHRTEKHRFHRSSHSIPDRHKHKRRHSFSNYTDSPKRAKHYWHQHSSHRHRYDGSPEEKHYSSRHRRNLFENERRHSRRGHEHYSSYHDKRCPPRRRSPKHKNRYHAERETELQGGYNYEVGPVKSKRRWRRGWRN